MRGIVVIALVVGLAGCAGTDDEPAADAPTADAPTASTDAAAPARSPAAEVLATLDLIDVSAEIRLDAEAFVPAMGGERLAAGDRVRTDPVGYAAIEYADGSVTRLDAASEVEIVRVGQVAGPDVTLQLDVGRAWHRLRDVPEGAAFEVQMAVGTAAVRGTTFVTSCMADDQCDVLVIDGEVEVTDLDGETVVLGPGQRVDLTADGVGGPEDLGDPEQVVAADPWLLRNDRRDQGTEGPPPSVTGAWATTYGQMTFDGGTARLSATYTGEDGSLVGDLDGRVYTGTWSEPASAQACATEVRGTLHWGRFQFLFSEDGRSFEGQWSYCDGPVSGSWTGTAPQ